MMNFECLILNGGCSSKLVVFVPYLETSKGENDAQFNIQRSAFKI